MDNAQDNSGPERKLRSILESFRTSEETGCGPLAEGLDESDKILVATFSNPRVCRHFQRQLSAAGIRSSTKAMGRKTNVEIAVRDRVRAFEILASHQKKYPDQRLRGVRRPFDFTIFGGLIGAVVGIVSFSYTTDYFLRAVVWLGFIGNGVVIGYVADRLFRNQRYGDRLQITITDLLFFTSAVALLISFWTFFVRLI